MYLRYHINTLTMKSPLIFVISFALLLSSVGIGSAIAQSQNQSATVPQNQTMATVSNSPQTIIANQTTVPAEQKTITVNQISKSVQGQSQLQPLQNQTITSEIGNLSNIDNKTMVQATGPAVTTIANMTTVPFNQTTIATTNTTNATQ